MNPSHPLRPLIERLKQRRGVWAGIDDNGPWVSTTWLLLRGERGRIVATDHTPRVVFPSERAPLARNLSVVDETILALRPEFIWIMFTLWLWLASVLGVLMPWFSPRQLGGVGPRLPILALPPLWTFGMWAFRWRSTYQDKVELARLVPEIARTDE